LGFFSGQYYYLQTHGTTKRYNKKIPTASFSARLLCLKRGINPTSHINKATYPDLDARLSRNAGARKCQVSMGYLAAPP
jgi:hypothetical protein